VGYRRHVQLELYARVRRAVLVEGRSQRVVHAGVWAGARTVRKMLEYSVSPGYQRQKPVRRPKLGLWQGVIDPILEDDKQRPKKQRHTAMQIFSRLRAEHSYAHLQPENNDRAAAAVMSFYPVSSLI